MHERHIFVAVVAMAVGSACATRSKGAEGGEPGTVTLEAEQGVAKSTAECSDINLNVDPNGSGKKFSKAGPWRLCDGYKLTVTNTLPTAACLTVLDESGTGYHVNKSLSARDGKWASGSIPSGSYKLGVCNPKGDDCPSDCGHMNDDAPGGGLHDTIKGNLSVVTSE